MTMNAIGFGRERDERETAERVVVPLDYRHACCIGSTGSGKSASIILPTLEDRIARGHTVLFFAYKGHEHRQVKAIARRHGRLEDVKEFGKPYGTHVNILSALSRKDAKQCIIDLGGGKEGGRDPYWPNAAGAYGEVILSILRSLYRLKRRYGEIDPEGASGLFREPLEIPGEEGEHREIHLFGRLDMEEEPSFRDVHTIAKDSSAFNDFFAGLSPLLEILEKKGRELMNRVESFEEMRIVTEGYFLDLSKLADLRDEAGHLEGENSNGNSTGNNGVRQVLENHLASVASREYANRGRKELVVEGEIMIVDIGGVDETILSTLLGIELDRLSMRLRRERDPRPVSVFIDEANRVLPGESDLHSDVLREAKVELVVAYQNEEQMIRKFGEAGWAAQKKNFISQYEMMPGFKALYRDGNGERVFRPLPLLLTQEEMDEGEMEHNALPENARLLRENFLVTGPLPERYRIVYDPRSFVTSESILLEDDSGNALTLSYLGKNAGAHYRRMLGIEENRAVRPVFPMLPKPGEDPKTVANDSYMRGRDRLRHLDEVVDRALDSLEGGEAARICDLPFLEFYRDYQKRRRLNSYGVLAEQAAFLQYLLYRGSSGEPEETARDCRGRFGEFMRESSWSPFMFDDGEDLSSYVLEKYRERGGGDLEFPEL